jgi:hypothetical protein
MPLAHAAPLRRGFDHHEQVVSASQETPSSQSAPWEFNPFNLFDEI